jgi:hypothetical protein
MPHLRVSYWLHANLPAGSVSFDIIPDTDKNTCCVADPLMVEGKFWKAPLWSR